MIQKGDKVKHFKFGRGVVICNCGGYANVDFYNFGKKSIMLEALSLVEDESINDSSLSKLQLINTVIDILTENRKAWMRLYDLTPTIYKRVAVQLTKKQLIEHLDVTASDEIVFKNRLLDVRNNLLKNGDTTIEVAGESIGKIKESKSKTPHENYEDFQTVCTKLRVTDSSQVFFARFILHLADEHRTATKASLNNISEYILNAYLYQISIGFMYNSEDNTNNPFYRAVENVYQNLGDAAIYKKALAEVYNYVKNHVIHQFLLSKECKYHFYHVNDDQLIFPTSFLSYVVVDSKKIDKQLVNKLSYFLTVNNPNNVAVPAYVSDLKSGEDLSGKKIEKFEYTNELNNMRGYLTKDIYTRAEFKAIMSKFKIPFKNMKKCLDRLDYRLRTKEIILKSIYPNTKAYLKSSIKDDVYRYSNPYNLDEYDRILRNLNDELFLIEVDSGVYLTEHNLRRNGISENVIKKFHSRVKSLGKNLTFFSVAEIKKEFPFDEVVQFCCLDDKQLIQFVVPIPEIQIIRLDSGDVVFFHGKSTAKGSLLYFIMAGKTSMSIYEIEDFADDCFGIKYTQTDIESDLKYTSFYYSEEMEKIYRNKKAFIEEVYGK